jgi:mono/diheme cytochrome c family protein
MQRRSIACSVLVVGVAVWVIASFGSLPAQRANAADVVPAGTALARGNHLAHVIGCTACHAPNLGGAKLSGDPTMLVLWAPNLTTGAGGFLAHGTAADFERAVRHGIGPDGKKLLVMPSWDYAALTDADLAAVYAYIHSVPPVAHETPPVKLGPKAPAMLAAGVLHYDADHLAHSTLPQLDGTPSVSASYGAYVARIAGCESCHGVNLDGSAPNSGSAVPNLSRVMPTWSDADFVTAIRSGKTPDGATLSDFMPWKSYRSMTDDELHALLAFLRTVPARPDGT